MSHGHKPCWLSKLDLLVACPSDGSIKSWGNMCQIQTLDSSGKSWEFSPGMCYSTKSGIYGEIVSQLLLPVSKWGFFSFGPCI